MHLRTRRWILDRYLPVECDTWHEEWQSVPARMTSAALELLTADFMAHGITEPVLLGPDGRVWDGHVRLWWARQVDIETLRVEILPDPLLSL